MVIGGCATLREEWRIQSALSDWQSGRAEWNKAHAKEIAECPELAEMP